MTVFQLKAGERARITSVGVGGAAAERLRALGIVRGAYITVLAFSLFRSSVLVGAGYARVSMRRETALGIEVER